MGNTVKTCGAAPLCGGLVQSRSYTRWVSRPAEWTGCSLARQQASASSVPEPVSPRLGPLVWPAGVPTSADVGSQAENPSLNGFWWEPEESGVEAAEARAAACACFRPACSLVFTDHTGASLGELSEATRTLPFPSLVTVTPSPAGTFLPRGGLCIHPTLACQAPWVGDGGCTSLLTAPSLRRGRTSTPSSVHPAVGLLGGGAEHASLDVVFRGRGAGGCFEQPSARAVGEINAGLGACSRA